MLVKAVKAEDTQSTMH